MKVLGDSSVLVADKDPIEADTPKRTLQAYYARGRDNYPSQDIVFEARRTAGTWGSEAIAATTNGSRDGMPGVTALPA